MNLGADGVAGESRLTRRIADAIRAVCAPVVHALFPRLSSCGHVNL